MAENPLPGLVPTHLANRLSEEARERILWGARQKADLILKRAIEGLHTRWLNSEPKTHVSFREYCASGQPAIQLAEAKMEAVRTELSAMATEFLSVANSWTELWNVLQKEVAAAATAFDLTGPQRSLLWAELQQQIPDPCPRADTVEVSPIEKQTTVTSDSPTDAGMASEGPDSPSDVRSRGAAPSRRPNKLRQLRSS